MQFNAVVVHGLQVGVQVIVAYGTQQQAVVNAVAAVHGLKYGAAPVEPPVATPAGHNSYAVCTGDLNCGATVWPTYCGALAFACQWHAFNMPKGT